MIHQAPTLHALCLMVALVCFLVAAFDKRPWPVNLTAFGLALWVFSLLL